MTETAVALDKQRFDAFVAIGRTALGTALTGAAPVPALAVARQLGIAAADAWMCFDIYKAYFDKDLSERELVDMLGTTGMIVLVGGIASYGTMKVAQSLLNEWLTIFPLGGWLLSGMMTGSSSLLLGLAWMTFVEDTYLKHCPGELPSGTIDITVE